MSGADQRRAAAADDESGAVGSRRAEDRLNDPNFSHAMSAEEIRAHLAAIVDSSDDAIVSKTLEGIITSWNRGAERIFGYTAAEAVGQHICLIVPEERRAEENVVMARLRRGERIDHFETERQTRDGRRLNVSLTVSAIRDAEGRIVGASKVARDITDRKRAEERLRSAEQGARFLAVGGAALATLADYRETLQKVARLAVPFFADWCAVDVLDEEGEVERVALVHADPTKLELARAMQSRWPFDRPHGVAKVLRTGEAELIQEIHDSMLLEVAQDDDQLGVLRKLRLRSYLCVPLRARKTTIGAVTFVTAESGRRYEDSDLRLAEDLAYRASIAIENAQLYQALQEADRRKDEFLATLSHELRSPLNAIVGWAHVLRDGAVDRETVRKAAETIHRNAQAQAQLVSDILDVSRIVAGKLRLDMRPVDLVDVIQAALETVRPAAEVRGVRLETVLDPGAGPVTADPDRLQQVVWNLLSNAIKFVPGTVGHVQIRLEGDSSIARLTVEDNGPGIHRDFLPYVFERFRQADASSTRRHGGLGLGLAIVRHLVELHGGTARAANREDQSGAIFTVELPRRSASPRAYLPAVERPPRAEEALWLESAPSLAGLRVLVVDDDTDAREVLRTVLERCRARVAIAASAREALLALREEKPHVILADIEMPEQNGYDLIRQVRALAPELGGLTPAAALTAYAGAQDRVNALRAGFQIHLAKPIQPAELAAVVASLARSPSRSPSSRD